MARRVLGFDSKEEALGAAAKLRAKERARRNWDLSTGWHWAVERQDGDLTALTTDDDLPWWVVPRKVVEGFAVTPAVVRAERLENLALVVAMILDGVAFVLVISAILGLAGVSDNGVSYDEFGALAGVVSGAAIPVTWHLNRRLSYMPLDERRQKSEWYGPAVLSRAEWTKRTLSEKRQSAAHL